MTVFHDSFWVVRVLLSELQGDILLINIVVASVLAAQSGPHAGPIDEWLWQQPGESPTTRTDGGELRYDVCADFGHVNVTAVLSLITPNAGDIEISTTSGGCSGAIKVPLSAAHYRLALHAAGQAPIIRDEKYAAVWIASIGDSYGSGEGAPDWMTTTPPLDEQSWVLDSVSTCLVDFVRDYLPDHCPNDPTRTCVDPVLEADLVALTRGALSNGDLPMEAVYMFLKTCGTSSKMPGAHTGWRRDEPAPTGDSACHRSGFAWPAVAADTLQGRLGRPVDFSQHACSGAKIGEPHEQPAQPVASDDYQRFIAEQLASLQEQIATRGHLPDAIFISVGGNDFDFAKRIADCYEHHIIQGIAAAGAWDILQLGDITDCSFRGIDPNEAGARYLDLQNQLRDAGLSSVKTYISTYPLVGGDYDNQARGCVLDEGSLEEGDDRVTGPLNLVIEASARAYGWTVVDNARALKGHGYCTADPWINDGRASWHSQGDLNGTMHPNAKGHAAMSTAAVAAVEGDASWLEGFAANRAVWKSGAAERMIRQPLVVTLADGTEVVVDRDMNLVSDGFLVAVPAGYRLLVDGTERRDGAYIPVTGFGPATVELQYERLTPSDMAPWSAQNGAKRSVVTDRRIYQVTVMNPEVLDGIVRLTLIDPVDQRRFPVQMSDLFKGGPSAMPAGAFYDDFEVELLVSPGFAASVEVNCAEFGGAPPPNLAIFPDLRERTPVRRKHRVDAQRSSMDEVTTFSVRKTGCYSTSLPTEGATSVILIPTISGPDEKGNVLNMRPSTSLHAAIGAIPTSFRNTVDLAIRGREAVSNVRCRNGLADFLGEAGYNQIRQEPAVSVADDCVVVQAALMPEGPGVNAPSNPALVCFTDLDHYCTANDQPFDWARSVFFGGVQLTAETPPMWTVRDQDGTIGGTSPWLPSWSGLGDLGTAISGVHVEFDGVPADDFTRSGQVHMSVYACLTPDAACNRQTGVANDPAGPRAYALIVDEDVTVR